LTSGGKKQVLDERHSENKDLEAVLNDVFRRCAAIGAVKGFGCLGIYFLTAEGKFWRLKLGSLAIQGA
jgi:hypothetical protein